MGEDPTQKMPDRRPVPAESRGKARRWLESLPTYNYLVDQWLNPELQDMFSSVCFKKGVGRERACEKLFARTSRLFGPPRIISRENRAFKVVFATTMRVQSMYKKSPDDAFDPAAFDEPAAEIVKSSIINGQAQFGSAQIGISAHAAGRYFERIDDRLAEGLLTLFDDLNKERDYVQHLKQMRHTNPDLQEISYRSGRIAWMTSLTELVQKGFYRQEYSEEKLVSTFIRSVLHADSLTPGQEARIIILDDMNKLIHDSMGLPR